MEKSELLELNLTLFDEGGAAEVVSAETGADSSNTEGAGAISSPAGAEEGKSAEAKKEPPAASRADTEEARREAFEKLIKGEYKDLFSERTQKIIDKRFKEVKTLEEQMNKARPILDMLAQKYGETPGDMEKLAEAMLRQEAPAAEGAKRPEMPAPKAQMAAQRGENAALQRTLAVMQRQRNASNVYAQWKEQGEAAKKVYPGFDLAKEAKEPRFVNLLKAGVDVRTAFEVVHQGEILGGAMQHTAKKVAEKVANSVLARGLRPAENGASGQSAAAQRRLPDILTKAGREEIARRVQKGERIEL